MIDDLRDRCIKDVVIIIELTGLGELVCDCAELLVSSKVEINRMRGDSTIASCSKNDEAEANFENAEDQEYGTMAAHDG